MTKEELNALKKKLEERIESLEKKRIEPMSELCHSLEKQLKNEIETMRRLIQSLDDRYNAAACGVAVAAGAFFGYELVSIFCDYSELGEEDKKVTKTFATAGGVLGIVGTGVAVIGSGTTTGLSVASIAAGTAAFGRGNIVAGVCASFAVPAVASIGAGLIRHMVYQWYAPPPPPQPPLQPQEQPQERPPLQPQEQPQGQPEE